VIPFAAAVGMSWAVARGQGAEARVGDAAVLAGVPVFFITFVRFMRSLTTTFWMARTTERCHGSNITIFSPTILAEIGILLFSIEHLVPSMPIGMAGTTK